MGRTDTDTPLEPYRPTDREVLVNQAIYDRLNRGLWDLVAEVRSDIALAGWDRIAAEVYRRTDGATTITGQSLKKWARRRDAVDRRNASRASASSA